MADAPGHDHTFTVFVMFDMMNALACRSMDTPVYALAQGFFSTSPSLAVGGSSWDSSWSSTGRPCRESSRPRPSPGRSRPHTLPHLVHARARHARKLANSGGGLSGSGTGTGHDAQAIGSMMNLRSNKKKKKKQKSERVEAPSSNKASFTPFGGKNVDSMV